MVTKNRPRSGFHAPVIRSCALCGQPWAVQPVSEEHRKAHTVRQIAFVCQECATRVRMEVEAAAGVVEQSRATA